ncbi:jg20956, partial [Pararge aegeria aegeria]
KPEESYASNEIVDKLANEAVKDGIHFDFLPYWSYALQIVKEYWIKIWKEYLMKILLAREFDLKPFNPQ